MSMSDLVHAALLLIDEHGGKLPGSQVSQLYQKNSQFKNLIFDHGGLKKFCANCPELEFVHAASQDDQAGIQRQGKAQTAVLDALLALIDFCGGQVAISQLPPFCAIHEDIIKALGGINKFCRMFQELEVVTSPVSSRDRYVRRSDMRSAGQIELATFVPDVSEDLISSMELSAELVAAKNLANSVVLKVSEIRFMQDRDRIKTHFKNGRALVDEVQALIASPMLLRQLPPMEVLEVGDKWFVVNGNRLLWVLKEYASSACPDLTVSVLLKKRFTTTNNGVGVDVDQEHRAKESQRFQSMALALDHKADKSNTSSRSQVSEGSASTATGPSSDAGDA